MKNIFVDYANSKVVVSSAFMKKVSNPFSTEYAQFMSVRNDNPGFSVETRQFKTNSEQDHHKGLTYEFMREFIRRFEDEENVEAVLETLEDQILISKGHSNTKKYPVVKRWFLRRYPNYAEFGMNVEELSAWRKKLKKEDEEFNKLSKKTDNVIELSATGTES